MNDNQNLISDDAEEQDLYEHHRIEVDKGQSALRIDKFLMLRIENASRNKIQEAAKAGSILVNNEAVKSNYKVRPDDVISIVLPHPPENRELIPENIPLNIVYEDDDLVIVNKDAGMVVHPAYSNYSGTLVNALAYHFEQLPMSQSGNRQPGLVHRIDKNTSGLLVIAKTDAAMTILAKQFYDHTIHRRYFALVWGDMENEEGTIETYIGRSVQDRKVNTTYADPEKGKWAVTHYKVLERLHYVTLVECRLETGRTHQIRVHMKYLGHPIFSDEVYGGDRIVKGTVFSKYKQFIDNCFKILPRQALHAKELGFIHPTTKKQMLFESELPEDFATVLEKWRNLVATYDQNKG